MLKILKSMTRILIVTASVLSILSFLGMLGHAMYGARHMPLSVWAGASCIIAGIVLFLALMARIVTWACNGKG